MHAEVRTQQKKKPSENGPDYFQATCITAVERKKRERKHKGKIRRKNPTSCR